MVAVAFDTSGVFGNGGTNVATVSHTFTIGAALTKGAIIGALFVFRSSDISAVSMTWGGVTMTPITGASIFDAGSGALRLFSLVAPLGGARSLSASWTGTGFATLAFMSFSNVDQTGGDTSFPNGKTFDNAGVGSTTTQTVTTVSGGASCAFWCDGVIASSPNSPTLDFNDDNSANSPCVAGQHTLSVGASDSYTIKLGGTDVITMGAFAIKAAADITVVLGDYTLDAGLAGLDATCDQIFICGAMPSSYADATSGANSLGSYNFGAGNAFTTDSSYASGMQISSVAITSGSVSTNGTVAAWAAVDSANLRLLASGTLTSGAAVTAGQSFTLTSFTIQIPHNLS